MSALDDIQALVYRGERRLAQRDLARLLKSDPLNLAAWLLLARLLDEPLRKADCYRHALEIDPQNQIARLAMEWLYVQPFLDMPLPEVQSLPEPTPMPPLPEREEALPEPPLFDWSSLQPTFPAQEPAPPEEMLVPLSQPHLPRRKVRWKWILIPLAILILLAGLAFGVWKLLGRRSPAQKPPVSLVLTQPPPATAENAPALSTTPLSSVLTPIVSPTPKSFTNMAMRIVWSTTGKLILWDRGQISPLTKTDTSTSQVVLSDDGKYAAFDRSGGIWVIDVHSTNDERLLVRPVALPLGDLPASSVSRVPDYFIWLPGTHTLLFNTLYSPAQGSARAADDLFMADYEKDTVTLLLPCGQGGDIIPSPDGSIAAVVSSDTVRLYDLKTHTVLQTFDYDAVILPSGAAFRVQPVWADDSRSIVLVIPPGDAISNPNSPARIWRISVDSGLQPEMPGEIYPQGGDIQISPNSKQLAYVLAATGSGELHLANTDGSYDRILLDGKAGIILGWSTTGETAAFALSADPPGIWLLDAAGAGAQPFSTGFSKGTLLTHFEWIDSTYFLMETRLENSTRLWLASASMQPLLLAEDPGGADIPFEGIALP